MGKNKSRMYNDSSHLENYYIPLQWNIDYQLQHIIVRNLINKNMFARVIQNEMFCLYYLNCTLQINIYIQHRHQSVKFLWMFFHYYYGVAFHVQSTSIHQHFIGADKTSAEFDGISRYNLVYIIAHIIKYKNSF